MRGCSGASSPVYVVEEESRHQGATAAATLDCGIPEPGAAVAAAAAGGVTVPDVDKPGAVALLGGAAYGLPQSWSAMRPPSRSPLRKAPCTVAG